ncbi:MAG: tRNA 5-methoxyuridine(34)/uridine 5-oxyacetic acid(34) synthase CmoB [Sedimenticola selenatireducens]|uniref:tRNA U34 carboxymethyltransferase n=1 Tax=Sedimenticola selenatireducens TaxID=191960 RepID=A0A558DM68_9GAMM|nr:tRNA 5-methoxyuridine(34)/uridine 5-oxyacetic acid(34) synthase CmoB [Sedimenticola selenatireducens]TVO78746.1 tRNA 5-methoxyuridine(34)/uridine 5-oxyacetic acid(34) synthase CmoB [Sedimenticola selenatireducens]TVT62108.1 MAG: tRNA 5-methoxyuridine(34)/uridine 5-oxyacetic acid(34) synthase CmoB [Sedimenticola selenatireducens]
MFQLHLTGCSKVINIDALCRLMETHGLEKWANQLPEQLQQIMQARPHGDLDRWIAAIDQLPSLDAKTIQLNSPSITASSENPPSIEALNKIETLLRQLHPWRKGPYNLHGIAIDTEWRSDWKWDRVYPHITPLKGRSVLDIGCGNGYHCWRMAGEGAELVVGVDPTQLFLAQFLAVRHFLGEQWPVHLLPMGIEDIPENLRAFDTVFSMGVLYHRRSPIDHLYELKSTLRSGGELVLETLVISGEQGQVLVPEGRYAKMRNVWFIPSSATLAGWLERCGFTNVKVVDETPTSINEQRATDWMHFESLVDYLDPDDPSRTIEGHPAPLRATLIATSS